MDTGLSVSENFVSITITVQIGTELYLKTYLTILWLVFRTVFYFISFLFLYHG